MKTKFEVGQYWDDSNTESSLDLIAPLTPEELLVYLS